MQSLTVNINQLQSAGIETETVHDFQKIPAAI